MSEVHTRNIRALADAASHDRGKTEALEQRVRYLEALVAMQAQALTEVRTQLVQLLMARGAGPTVR